MLDPERLERAARLNRPGWVTYYPVSKDAIRRETAEIIEAYFGDEIPVLLTEDELFFFSGLIADKALGAGWPPEMIELHDKIRAALSEGGPE